MADIETMAVVYENEDGIPVYQYKTKPFMGMLLPDYIGYRDSILLDIDDFGIFLYITLDKPTKQELKEFAYGQREIRLTHTENILWFTFRFGKLDWQDAPYTPFLSKSLHLVSNMVRFADLCKKITVILIDTSAGTVSYTGDIPLSDSFSDKMFRLIYQIMNDSFDFCKETYFESIDEIQANLSPKDIAEESKHTACIAEAVL